MKTLILIRHAKATKSMFNINDFDRPLVEQGILDAYAMSKWMKHHKHLPDYILCSPAARTFETALAFAKTLDYPFDKIHTNKDLYNSSVNKYFEILSEVDDKHKTIFLIGHNPDITWATAKLTEFPYDDIPTCGIVGIDFNMKTWGDIDQEKGTLKFFEYPKKEK